MDAALWWSTRSKKKLELKSDFSHIVIFLVNGILKINDLNFGTYITVEKNQGEFRVFPISNWTEMDVWQYIAQEDIEIPNIYFAHERNVFNRRGVWLADTAFINKMDDEEVVKKVRLEPLEMLLVQVRYYLMHPLWKISFKK